MYPAVKIFSLVKTKPLLRLTSQAKTFHLAQGPSSLNANKGSFLGNEDDGLAEQQLDIVQLWFDILRPPSSSELSSDKVSQYVLQQAHEVRKWQQHLSVKPEDEGGQAGGGQRTSSQQAEGAYMA